MNRVFVGQEGGTHRNPPAHWESLRAGGLVSLRGVTELREVVPQDRQILLRISDAQARDRTARERGRSVWPKPGRSGS